MSWWNDEREAILTKLWGEGYSSSQIAGKLGITRSAVIGKVYRMKIQGGSVPGRGGRQKENFETSSLRIKLAATAKKMKQASAKNRPFAIGERAPPKFGPIEPYIEKPQPYEPPMEQRVTWDQLEDHHCRFVLGDVAKPGWCYCGGKKLNGVSYCEGHARIVFAAPETAHGMHARAPDLTRGGQIERSLGEVNPQAIAAVPAASEREREDA